MPCWHTYSGVASACCNGTTCEYAPADFVCLKGDSDIVGGGCQKDSLCPGDSDKCPPAPAEEDGTSCNNGENTCRDGACTGQSGFRPCKYFHAILKTYQYCFLQDPRVTYTMVLTAFAQMKKRYGNQQCLNNTCMFSLLIFMRH